MPPVLFDGFETPKHRGGGPEVIAKSLGLGGSNHRNSQQPGGVVVLKRNLAAS